MVSTCIDPVLHDLQFLRSNPGIKCFNYLFKIEILQREFQLLRTFLLSVRKWGSNDVYLGCTNKRNVSNFRLLRTFLLSVRKWGKNDVYLGCTDKRNVSLQFFVSSIEDTIKKYAVNIHSLCFGKEGELGNFTDMTSNFIESIRTSKQEITKAYTYLLECSSLQFGPFMRDDELMELVDSLLQNLVNLRGRLNLHYRYRRAQAELEAFEDKLIFLKNLIRFSILRGIELGQLEDLLNRIHIVSLNAARLCYTCDGTENEYEVCCLISDLHVFEICIKILRASKSSANLQSVARDMYIMRDFNDSLISSLWKIIQQSFVSMDSVKDQMEILCTGLKYFRNFLREPQEKMDELNEKIGALITEAGVIICSLSMNQVKGGEVNCLEAGDALDCYDMLVNTNSAINLIKDDISGSSKIGGLPSYHSIKGHAIPKTSSLVPSKRKTAVTQEVVVGFDDEAKTIVDRLLGGSRQLEIVPIVGMPGIGKTTLAKKVNNNPSIMSHFHIRLWCCVSQVYDRKNLMLQLLCDDDKYSGMNDDDLLQRLYQNLKGKRYLVVFDDVWDIEFWNDLRLSFPNDEHGSRILFTSRFSDVANLVEFGKEPHNLRSLTEWESWELLQKKVFRNEDCPQELHILGKEIAKNCKGITSYDCYHSWNSCNNRARWLGRSCKNINFDHCE